MVSLHYRRLPLRAVVQRVSRAAVRVDGAEVGRIGPGLLILLGVAHGDGENDAAYLAAKIAALRIFQDEGGRMNRSLIETGGGALVVSQFTLYGDVRRGRRPSFDAAAPPDLARHLYEHFISLLRAAGITVATGIFQAEMEVELVNQGPVTILCDTPLHTA